MTKITLEPSVSAKLSNVAERVELCDESGRTLGHFLPPGAYERLLFDMANAFISDEELDRRAKEPGGCSLAEIWARLDKA